MKSLLLILKELKFQFETLKQKLKNEGVPFKNNKEYCRLHKAVSRCTKKIEAQETISSENSSNLQKILSPPNVAGFKKNIKKKLINLIGEENLPIIEKKDDSVISAAELPKKIQNKILINVKNSDNSTIIENNLPAVGKILTFYEKELLSFARLDLAWMRGRTDMRQLTNSERLALDKSLYQPPTVYEEDLLACWKLYPVVFADPLYEGEEPRREYYFGAKEAELKKRKKLKLCFPNRSPKITETWRIVYEFEVERLKSELIFLKGLLENNSSMKKNAALPERITLLSRYAEILHNALNRPEFKGCGF